MQRRAHGRNRTRYRQSYRHRRRDLMLVLRGAYLPPRRSVVRLVALASAMRDPHAAPRRWRASCWASCWASLDARAGAGATALGFARR